MSPCLLIFSTKEKKNEEDVHLSVWTYFCRRKVSVFWDAIYPSYLAHPVLGEVRGYGEVDPPSDLASQEGVKHTRDLQNGENLSHWSLELFTVSSVRSYKVLELVMRKVSWDLKPTQNWERTRKPLYPLLSLCVSQFPLQCMKTTNYFSHFFKNAFIKEIILP